MNGNEIRSQIDSNNEKIRLRLDSFVLTPEIKGLLAENETIFLMLSQLISLDIMKDVKSLLEQKELIELALIEKNVVK